MTGSNKDPEEWHDIIGNKAHKEEMAVKFKDNNSPLKIAIVVDMWLTGFDVPSLATMYVYTGHDVLVSTSTYEELKNYKLGSWLPGNADGETGISTFEEVLALVAENDIKIQIELKPTEHDTNLEEEAIRLIYKYGLEDRTMVISLHEDAVRRVKELDPSITTAVCFLEAWEDVKNIPYMDNLSVSDNAVTPDLVRQMHDTGIKVFCWTVDKLDSVQYLVSCGVDVIGTNDPMSIQTALEAADTSGGLHRPFHILIHTIASMER